MTETKGRRREVITEAREAEIIAIIDEWPEQLAFTREGLVKRVLERMGLIFTRQGLMKREAIRLAFERREKEIRGDTKPRAEKEPLTAVLEGRVESLQARINEQAAIIERYEQLFLIYRYNARQHGVGRDQLEAPIPVRNQTEGSRG